MKKSQTTANDKMVNSQTALDDLEAQIKRKEDELTALNKKQLVCSIGHRSLNDAYVTATEKLKNQNLLVEGIDQDLVKLAHHSGCMVSPDEEGVTTCGGSANKHIPL